MNCEKNDSLDFELNDAQIKELIRLAKFNDRDIFYDLGSGSGKVVREVIKQTKVYKSIGVENNKTNYKKARECAIQKLSKKELKKIDFWLGDITNDDKDGKRRFVFNYKNGSVVFANLDEEIEDVQFYKKRLKWKKVRIIKKDIPLVGYHSIANRKNPDCWFFLSKPPFKRIRSIKKWIKSISPDFKTISDVCDYYYKTVEIRMRKNEKFPDKDSKKEARSSLLGLKMVINERFYVEDLT